MAELVQTGLLLLVTVDLFCLDWYILKSKLFLFFYTAVNIGWLQTCEEAVHA